MGKKSEVRSQKPEHVIDPVARTVDGLPEDLLADGLGRLPPRVSRQQYVTIGLPIGELNERAYLPSHVETQLNPKHGRALQRLMNGLNAEYGRGWRRGDVSMADVLRWLLDQLPD
jgi:hypothetical protein